MHRIPIKLLRSIEDTYNLAKIGDGFAESPIVMVGDTQKTRKFGKNRVILKPSLAFVETKYVTPI
jgi:hypothetical protein